MLQTTRRFLSQHPLTRERQAEAWWRVIRWQLESRLRREIVVDWIGGARLAVTRGMTGATGNIYAGLHEFADMAFLMHLLRPGDLFVDAGANVGTFVLATKVCGAHALAVEPDPGAAGALCRNLALNAVEDRVRLEGVALGSREGTVRFTVGRDTVNQVVDEATAALTAHTTVPLARLDALLAGRAAVLLKLDVEGYEAEALAGARATLEDHRLLAVETETADETVVRLLTEVGLTRAFYDPFSRSLSPEPVAGVAASNALYVRNAKACVDRCRSAPRRRVLGRDL